MAKGEKCSFCGRGENEVRLLMPGRDGCICDECAEQAYLLSEEYLHKKKKKRVPNGPYPERIYLNRKR